MPFFFHALFGAEQRAFCLNYTNAIDQSVSWKDFSKCMRREENSWGKSWREGLLISRCDGHFLRTVSVELW